mmetsp:Transcript_74207/g.154772  ORF Transcript_74207/g.154772 Transcript_74207/m.154772 type:complete len:90 (-) Transcript_74207:520-789(-)
MCGFAPTEPLEAALQQCQNLLEKISGFQEDRPIPTEIVVLSPGSQQAKKSYCLAEGVVSIVPSSMGLDSTMIQKRNQIQYGRCLLRGGG